MIAEGGYQTVALMSPNDDYGRGLADVLVDQLRENGIRVTISYLYDPNGTNFAPDVRQVLETDPESIAVIGASEQPGSAFPNAGRSTTDPKTLTDEQRQALGAAGFRMAGAGKAQSSADIEDKAK